VEIKKQSDGMKIKLKYFLAFFLPIISNSAAYAVGSDKNEGDNRDKDEKKLYRVR